MPDDPRAFFSTRAADWDDRFPDDGPAFGLAIAELAPPVGGTALDVGCGTGRALPALREALGRRGRAIGVDLTPAMLEVARRKGRAGRGVALVLGDAARLPLPAESVDAVLAAGLLGHLTDPEDVLGEIARVARPGGRLAVFHPAGRAALAARRGRVLSDDDVMAPPRLQRLLEASGWQALSFDDADDRYLALAVRTGAVS